MTVVKAVLACVLHTGLRPLEIAFGPHVDDIVAINKKDTAAGNVLLYDLIQPATRPRFNTELDAGAPLIYTVRDPMRSMLAVLVDKNPKYGPTQHMLDWLELIDLVNTYGGSCVRIAQPECDADFQAAVNATGMYKPQHEGADYFRTVEAFGRTYPTAVRKAYIAGDMAYVESAIPNELAVLRANQSSLKPFLDGLGMPQFAWYE